MNNNDICMKNLKVSFHHPSYIYKFKVELNVLEDTNMFCIDPHRTIEQYNRIISHLILTVEEKIVFETLSLGKTILKQLLRVSSLKGSQKLSK